MTQPAPKNRSYHHGALREALLTRAAEVIEAFGIEALTLRGLARDLGVSHGAPNRHFANKEALLAALAAVGYQQMKDATLAAAEAAGSDPWLRLNAMGRGYLKWALSNRALYAAINHPDVQRFATKELRRHMSAFRQTVRDASDATQAAGRAPAVDAGLLALFTNAVPAGAAMLLRDPAFEAEVDLGDLDRFVADYIELVVPIRNRVPQPRD